MCYFSYAVTSSIFRYALLHLTMGGFDGSKGWCFVEGGMGSVSMAIARAAQQHGADLYTDKVCLLSCPPRHFNSLSLPTLLPPPSLLCLPLPLSLPPPCYHFLLLPSPLFPPPLPTLSSSPPHSFLLLPSPLFPPPPSPPFPHTHCHLMQPVKQIIVKNNVAEGVLLGDGTVVRAKTVLSNATPKVTFFDLLSDVRDSPTPAHVFP